MIFESVEHAMHYASGLKIEVVFYEHMVIDVTDFKDKHPGIFNLTAQVELSQFSSILGKI